MLETKNHICTRVSKKGLTQELEQRETPDPLQASTSLCSISCLQSSLRVLIRYVTRRISATPQSRWVQAPMKRYRMARDDLNWNKASKSIRGLDNQTESSLDKWGRIDRGGAGLEWVLQRTEDQASSF